MKVGERFGMLTVVLIDGTAAICVCDCGNTARFNAKHVERRRYGSCGCLGRPGRKGSHGWSQTRLYNIWERMKQRCDNPNYNKFSYWGGKGVSVCEAWYDFITFRDWALENGYRDDLTIDRIDSDGDYEPANCRWITQSENSRRGGITSGISRSITDPNLSVIEREVEARR